MPNSKSKSKNNFLSKFDIFGRNIQLNFQKEKKQKTKIGAVVSIVLIVVLMTYLVIKMVDLIVYH